jgi:hypothetical protein
MNLRRLPSQSGSLRGRAARGLVLLLGVCAWPASAFQDSQPTEKPYWLRVTGEPVNVRSRADVNSRIVGKVHRDDILRGVGREFDWYRIAPPAGVFSLVSAKYIMRQSDTRGVVKIQSGSLRIRVGSQVVKVDPLKSEVQTRLQNGTQVEIIGEQDDWLKIVPPGGVYMYISADFVERVSDEVAARLKPAVVAPTSRPSPAAKLASATEPAKRERPELSGKWGQRLRLVEGAIQSEKRKPLLDQEWTKSLVQLRPIAAQRDEPMVGRLASKWIERLEKAVSNQGALRAARRIAKRDARDRTQFEREQERLAKARAAWSSRPAFDARGQLRPSFALRAEGRGLRYKLLDPITRKVAAYLDFPSDGKFSPEKYIGKYVGILGKRVEGKKLGAALFLVEHISVLNAASQPARNEP